MVTVVAVAAGLLVLIVPLCGDGMSAMPQHAVGGVVCMSSDGPSLAVSAIPMGGGSACMEVGVGPAAADSAVEPIASGVPMSLPADLARSTPGTGVLFACVAFLIAVLATMLWSRRSWSVSFTVARRRVLHERIIARPVPGLSLTELCVLRT